MDRHGQHTPTELDQRLHASVMKREAVKEREQAEAKRKRDEEFMLGVGATDMSEQELMKICDSDRRMYYRTVELNDKLYIHYKGWKDIRGLEKWTGLRSLYAESNAFSRIEGLQNCTQLKSLFLQENCISHISGLETCTQLWNINLSNNFITRISGLSHLKNLNTLCIAKNRLGAEGVEDLAELAETTICSLDIQDNLIWDPDVVPEVLMRMKGLRVLYLKGNECTKKIPNYRKTVTQHCEDLRYLDDRPVFEDDRRAAAAFNRGGLEEERAERRRIREEKNAAHDRNMRAFQDMIERVKLEKREKEAMRREDKYTEEEDPGLWKERDMKRRQLEWEKANEEDLKDHELERAKRILKGERERGELDGLTAGEDDTAKADAATSGKSEAEDTAGETGVKELKEDNRRLVYEDIWDDAPARGSAASRSAGTAVSSGRTPSAPSAPSASAETKATTPADDFSASSAFAGARPGWYFGTGDRGLGYYRDKNGQVKATETKPKQETTWYSQYSSRLQETQEKIERGLGGPPASFAPPSRRAGAAETAAAAAAASSPADSELQEMD
eukprot:TRINITY_DN66141_c0_g1_i1.p1 TRINITY_DN66141_c0_g1~~TRINITY_DN66141_c0_g1_i1.p1  ORF type:complete len:584 (-),score=123.03 TRINITY_DN66141_c0_g1_i1:65-1744(-)